MLHVAHPRRQLIFFLLTELLIAAEEGLQAARHGIIRIRNAHKVDARAISISEGLVANSRRTEAYDGELILRKAKAH